MKFSANSSGWKHLKLWNAALIGLGAAMLGLFIIAVREPIQYVMPFNTVAVIQALLYLCSCWISLTRRLRPPSFAIIILFAIAFRIAPALTPPRFSTDIYRYIWDGRVQAAGLNPYRYIPADPALAHLRDKAIYPNINRREYARTIYPPGAQAIYFFVTRISESVIWMKVVIIGFEAVTVWALVALLKQFGLPRERVLLYAWHPLVIWEFAGGGHIDAAAIAFLAVAFLARLRHCQIMVGMALGCATLVKLFPIVLFPALYRRWGWKMPTSLALTVLAGYLPYASVGAGVFGFLSGYAREEGLLSGDRFFLLILVRRVGMAISARVFVSLVLAVLLTIACWAIWKPERDAASYLRRAFSIAIVFTVVLSPHYLWYFSWLVPFLCFTSPVSLLYLTSACTFIFGGLYGSWFGSRDEMFMVNVFVYTPFALLALMDLWRFKIERDATSRLGEQFQAFEQTG